MRWTRMADTFLCHVPAGQHYLAANAGTRRLATLNAPADLALHRAHSRRARQPKVSAWCAGSPKKKGAPIASTGDPEPGVRSQPTDALDTACPGFRGQPVSGRGRTGRLRLAHCWRQASPGPRSPVPASRHAAQSADIGHLLPSSVTFRFWPCRRSLTEDM
jgi:hypothetical protein